MINMQGLDNLIRPVIALFTHFFWPTSAGSFSFLVSVAFGGSTEEKQRAYYG